MQKKRVIQTHEAAVFAETMSVLSQKKYTAARELLQEQGFLYAPQAEKVAGHQNLFVIRIMTDGNERFFYCYDTGTTIFILSGYEKKTAKIPARELEKALQIKKGLGL